MPTRVSWVVRSHGRVRAASKLRSRGFPTWWPSANVTTNAWPDSEVRTAHGSYASHRARNVVEPKKRSSCSRSALEILVHESDAFAPRWQTEECWIRSVPALRIQTTSRVAGGDAAARSPFGPWSSGRGGSGAHPPKTRTAARLEAARELTRSIVAFRGQSATSAAQAPSGSTIRARSASNTRRA